MFRQFIVQFSFEFLNRIFLSEIYFHTTRASDSQGIRFRHGGLYMYFMVAYFMVAYFMVAYFMVAYFMVVYYIVQSFFLILRLLITFRRLSLSDASTFFVRRCVSRTSELVSSPATTMSTITVDSSTRHLDVLTGW